MPAQKYNWAELDNELLRLRDAGGNVTQFGRDKGIPKSTVFLRLNMLGAQRRIGWNTEEEKILRSMKHCTYREIQKALVDAGFALRKRSSICAKRAKLGMSINPDTNGNYSTNTLAAVMGVTDSMVQGWIRRKWLRAFRPVGDKFAPGFAWVITPAAVREFIVEYVAYLDKSWPKTDRFFIVDILTGASGEKKIRHGRRNCNDV